MEAALRLVSDTTPGFPWPGTGESLSVEEAHRRIADLIDARDGLLALTEKQARDNRRLERRIEVEEDPHSHPQGAEIVALIERWKAATGHAKSKVSADRVKAVKARVKDGYAITDDDPFPDHATLELAIDGIAAHPFVVNGQRVPTGKPSQRHDRLGIALGGGEEVEKFARLGYAARKAGWRPETGWPT